VITLDHHALEGCDMVVLKGRLVASISGSIADELIAIFDDGRGVLHIDMAGVEYIDSRGLSVLVGVMRRVQKDDGVFALVNVSDEVLALLELTRLSIGCSVWMHRIAKWLGDRSSHNDIRIATGTIR